MTDSEWLAGLKVGDEVAVPRRWDGYDVYPVRHATKTRITAGYSTYRRKDGWEVGANRYGRITPVTDEIRSDIRHREAVRRFRDIADDRRAIEALPTSNLEAALALLTPPPPETSKDGD